MANRKRVFGFVVYCEDGLFHLADPKEGSEFRYGTLWFGNAATVFKSKRVAKGALARTKKYRDQRYPGFWPWLEKARVHRIGRTV